MLCAALRSLGTVSKWRQALLCEGSKDAATHQALLTAATHQAWPVALALLALQVTVQGATCLLGALDDWRLALQLLSLLRCRQQRLDCLCLAAAFTACGRWETALEVQRAGRSWGLEVDLKGENRLLDLAEARDRHDAYDGYRIYKSIRL